MKKPLQALLVLLLLCCVAFAQNPSKIIQWQLRQSYAVKLPNKDNVPLHTQTVTENGATSLLFYNQASHQLLRYHLPSQRITDTIPVNIYPGKDIWAIRYVSPDTIFILYNASQNPSYNHSGTLVRINSRGELRQQYSLKGFPLVCSECSRTGKDSLVYITSKYAELPYTNGKLYVSFEPYYHSPGDSDFVAANFPLCGYVDVATGLAHVVDLHLPQTRPGAKYAKRAKVPSLLCNRQGNLVCALNYGNTIYTYNPASAQTHAFHIPSVFTDTVLPLDTTLFKNTPQDDYTQVSPRNLFYNPYEKYYVRFTALPLPANAAPEDRRNPDYLVSVIDKNFHLLAEGILPTDMAPFCYFTPGGIGFWNKSKSPLRNSDTVHFSEFKLKWVKGSRADLEARLQKRTQQPQAGMEEYLMRNFPVPAQKSVVFFIPLSACKTCIGPAVKYISDVNGKDPVFLLVAAENKDKVQEFLVPYYFTDDSKVWRDTTLKYEKYLPPPVVNGVVVFMQNGKKVKETNLYPGTLPAITADVKVFLELK